MNWMLTVWDALHGDFFRGLGESGLMWATEAGLAALPFALAILLVNLLGRRWLSAGQMGALWCLVLVRLLLPSAPASPLSVRNLTPHVLRTIDGDERTDNRNIAVSRVYELNPDAHPASGPILSHPTTMPIPTVNWEDFVTGMCELLWLTAAVGTLVWTLFNHGRFCQRVRRAALCGDERLLRLWGDCCLAAGIRGRLPIVVFDGVQQPAVMGLLHPELLLPPETLDLSDDELRMIMLHELAHVRRWDIAVNWVLVVLRATHWWHPIYWLAASRFRTLREQACDAFVIRAAQSHTSRDYSELLLKLAEHAPDGLRWRVMLPASPLGLFQSYFCKREIRLRLKAMRNAGVRYSRWRQAAFGMVAILAALCGLTDAEPPAVAQDSSLANGWFPAGIGFSPSDGSLRTRESFQGPLEVRSYSMDEIVRRSTPEELEAAGGQNAVGWVVAGMLARTRTEEEQRFTKKLPGAGEETPGGSYHWDGNRLIVRASKALHDELSDRIQTWERSGAAQITIECRMMTSANRELAGAAGIEWQSLDSGTGWHDEPLAPVSSASGTVVRACSRVEDHVPVFVASLNDEQVKAITAIAQQEPRVNVVFSPKVTVWNGQEATIFSGASRPFVVGFDERLGAEPLARIENIDEGSKIRLRPVLSEDRRRIRLAGTIDLTSIVDVTSVQASMAGGNRAVQVPRVRHSQIAVASEIEDGRSLLIRCSPTFENTNGLYVLLTPRRLELVKSE